MWFRFRHWIKSYHAHMAKRHYRHKHFSLCLHHLKALKKWDIATLQQPIFAGYLAMCHYQLKDWSHLTEEVERALFLLRRHVPGNDEAHALWQELKSHLADLRALDSSQQDTKKKVRDSRR